MKLKYIIPVFTAVLAMLMTGCEDDDNFTQLGSVQVSSSYVSIPMNGGADTIVVKATSDFTFEKVVSKKDSVKWLDIVQSTDIEGNPTLIFKAPKTLDGRTAEVLLHCGNETQRINVIQGVATVSNATAAEVIAGPDSKTYRVTGVVTAIANTVYGNWYLQDKTGQIYIYGTLDKKGNEKNFSSLGIEVGDEVTVEGPKTTYGTVIELVNVTVIKINKSLIKVDSVENDTIGIEGGEAIAHLTCKGQGVSVDIPENAKTWLSISSIRSVGTNATVKFKATPNAGGERSTKVVFHTTDGSKDYTSEAVIVQKGAIVQLSIAEFLAAAIGEAQYRLSGVITKVSNDKYGNFYLKDFSGETYVYGLADFKAKGLKPGDIVTIVGKRGEYKSTPQVLNAVLEELKAVTEISIADVLKKPNDTNTLYMVTGEITEIKNDVYGNLVLKDGDSEIYLHGCYPGYGATGDARKGIVASKGLKVGDKVTVIAHKTEYKGTTQLANGIYYTHESVQ